MPTPRHRATRQRQPATAPPHHTTPEERRKFLVLVVMAGVVVVLIWIATLPWNLQPDGPTAPGPGTLFGTIAEQLSASSRIADVFRDVSEAKQSQ